MIRIPRLLSAVVFTAAALAAAQVPATQAPASSLCRGPEVPLPQVCGADLRSPRISCFLPTDVQGALQQPELYLRQRASDLFSWQVLIALDWPALRGRRGEPDPAKPITAPGPRVWETWKETGEVFRAKNGQPVAPEPWDAPETLPSVCRGADKLLVRDEKVDDLLDSTVQPTYADGTLPGTLTDQAGRRVRYEIRLNRTAFDYIVRDKLWDGSVQSQAKEILFPDGSQIVKAAWREVDGGAADRFLTTDACVCETPKGQEITGCRRQRMGLVGFHVMTKTSSAPQWIWSTFEQMDNVNGTHGAPASFHKASCPDCIPDRQAPPGFPNQATRLIPIPSQSPDCRKTGEAVDDIVQLNRDLQRALAKMGSVLSRYELISTQWPYRTAGPGAQPPTVFDVRPRLLGNTTLETYIQETSSCMGCHAVAGTDRSKNWVSANFTFTLNDAYPVPDQDPTSPQPDRVPRTQRVIPPPDRPVSSWDLAHWNDVTVGYRVATETYELVPAHVGSKLHCSSCHLGAGRDPESAWWVGMFAKYKTPESLYNRINQCFSRSENGSDICSVGSSTSKAVPCDQQPTMRALITYLQWLDEQWKDWKERTHFSGPTPNGFPPLSATPSGKASAARGGSIFQQKCSFCHGAEGQGRYLSHTYYRPALWGPESYNIQAGMGSKLQDLAAFVHANMPYGNAGALTVEEAWDVACFVDAQNRPGKKASRPEETICPTSGS
ncbi:MAG TPA: c-type cytochrome [Thermoanaerobaculia bacterium]|jgi:cytochrome c|nr:c-type cytochrome [Thermoanaerobaculia bacterium]